MSIIIDTREVELIKILKSKKGIEVKDDFIEVGDLLLPDGFVIERKTEKDFIASILDKRLFTQLNNLTQYENPIVAIIHDDLWKDFYFCHNRYIHNVYVGVLTTIATSYPKVKLQYFYDTNQFVDYVISLHKKLTEEGKSERPKVLMRKPTTDAEIRENILSMIPGVGITTSKKLLEKYGTVHKVCEATVEDLVTVEKLGDKLANRIKEMLNE